MLPHLLAKQEIRPLWENISPLIFTAKCGEAVTMVRAIEDAAMKQEAGLGGITEQKDHEETELEDADFIWKKLDGWRPKMAATRLGC